MKRYAIILSVVVGLVSFLTLPFPFKGFNSEALTYYTDWEWFGGYHIIVDKFNLAGHEMKPTGDVYPYASTWFPFLLVIVCLALGLLAYIIFKKLAVRRERW